MPRLRVNAELGEGHLQSVLVVLVLGSAPNVVVMRNRTFHRIAQYCEDSERPSKIGFQVGEKVPAKDLPLRQLGPPNSNQLIPQPPGADLINGNACSRKRQTETPAVLGM